METTTKTPPCVQYAQRLHDMSIAVDRSILNALNEQIRNLCEFGGKIRIICHEDVWPKLRYQMRPWVRACPGNASKMAFTGIPFFLYDGPTALVNRVEWLEQDYSVIEITADKIYVFGDVVLDMVSAK